MQQKWFWIGFLGFLSFFNWDIDPTMDLYLGIAGKRSEPYGEDAECINCYVGTWKSKSILMIYGQFGAKPLYNCTTHSSHTCNIQSSPSLHSVPTCGGSPGDGEMPEPIQLVSWGAGSPSNISGKEWDGLPPMCWKPCVQTLPQQAQIRPLLGTLLPQKDLVEDGRLHHQMPEGKSWANIYSPIGWNYIGWNTRKGSFNQKHVQYLDWLTIQV